MEDNIKLVKLNIWGNTYTIKTDSSEEQIKELEKYLNNKKNEILGKNSSVNSLKDAVIITLNISDELFKLKKEIKKRDIEMGTKAEDLIKRIENDLKNGYMELK